MYYVTHTGVSPYEANDVIFSAYSQLYVVLKKINCSCTFLLNNRLLQFQIKNHV